MNPAFESGSGLLDALAGRFDDYGAQLDYVINKVLAKALKVARPLFDEPPDSFTGALLREQWITEKLLEALWDRLPEEAKRDIAKKTEELLKRTGVDPALAGRAAGGLLTGGFSAARLILGFRFHILLAQLANLLIPSLSLATNAALQRFAGLLFGPWGWIISIVLLVPTLIGWLFPRELDKYIPAVFVMGVRRLQTEVPAMS
ncbi:MAG: hypothetical protein AB7G75_35805 [Candidatus Binatia bacterium]